MTAHRPARHRMRIALAASAALLLSAVAAPAQDASQPAAQSPAASAIAPAPAGPAAQSPVPAAPAAPSSAGAAPAAPAAATPAVPVEPAPPASPATVGTPAIEAAPPAADPAPAPAQPGIPTSDVSSAFAPTGAASEEAGPQHDLSAWGMFMAADVVVKSVMIGLAAASVLTWTVALVKVVEIAFARRRARGGVKRLAAVSNLPRTAGLRESGWRRGPVAALVAAASAERERSDGLPADGVKERAISELSRIEARAGRRMSRGTGLLATIGSISPFVGLFGTVWGIMRSFIGIAEANTTNLSVVAPGIAEALLATAIGLVAAIPAVIFYNAFNRSISGYRSILSDASARVLQHLSRDLDRARAIAPARAAASAPLRAAE